MKILLITEYFPQTEHLDIHGGVEARNYHIAKALTEKHRISVIASYEKEKPAIQTLEGIHIQRVGRRRTYTASEGQLLVRIYFILAATLRAVRSDFDLVEGSGYMGWIPAIIASFLKRKEVVLFIADTFDLPVYSPQKKILLQILQRLFFKSINPRVITISQTVQKKLVALGIKVDRSIVLSCGTNIQINRGLKVKKRDHMISCVSRLVDYKKIDTLLYAFAILKPKFRKLRLTIVGTGDKLEVLSKLAKNLGISKQVVFKKYVHKHLDVIKIVKSSSIFCLPSMYEGFGIATIEALSLGVPVIVADIPINHEVTRGKGVFFFRLQDEIDLANKIEKLLSDKPLYKSLQKKGLTHSRQYDWSIIQKQTLQFYQKVYNTAP